MQLFAPLCASALSATAPIFPDPSTTIRFSVLALDFILHYCLANLCVCSLTKASTDLFFDVPLPRTLINKAKENVHLFQ